MSERRYVERPIKEICDIIPENHTFTKSYIKEHEGTYPVYSATVGKPFGYMSTYTQDEPMLIVVNYGDSGTTYYVDDPLFSLGRNACGLRIKKEFKDQISLEYIKYVIEEKFKQMAKGEGGIKNLNQTMIKNTVVKLPQIESRFDFEYQKQIVENFKQVELYRQQLLLRVSQLNDISVNLSTKSGFINVPISKICSDLPRGNSKYTKTYCRENNGNYPLYSATNNGPLGFMNSYDYDGEYLTICINGIAGKITIFNCKFSTNADRVVLLPLENIDIKYIKYVAEPILRSVNKGRIGDKGKNEYTKLTPQMILSSEIPMPINENGEFDIKRQKEFAQKYDQIEEIKKNLVDKITELTNIVIA